MRYCSLRLAICVYTYSRATHFPLDRETMPSWCSAMGTEISRTGLAVRVGIVKEEIIEMM